MKLNEDNSCSHADLGPFPETCLKLPWRLRMVTMELLLQGTSNKTRHLGYWPRRLEWEVHSPGFPKLRAWSTELQTHQMSSCRGYGMLPRADTDTQMITLSSLWVLSRSPPSCHGNRRGLGSRVWKHEGYWVAALSRCDSFPGVSESLRCSITCRSSHRSLEHRSFPCPARDLLTRIWHWPDPAEPCGLLLVSWLLLFWAFYSVFPCS